MFSYSFGPFLVQELPYGIQTKPPQNPCTIIYPPKNPMPNFRTIKIFQKALNDITQK